MQRMCVINTARFTAICIRFGKGRKTLILISGLNVRDAKGKMAALGVAYTYRCFPVITPEATIEIAEKLGCEPVLYEEYGHSACEEAPDFSNRVITFLLNTEKTNFPFHNATKFN